MARCPFAIKAQKESKSATHVDKKWLAYMLQCIHIFELHVRVTQQQAHIANVKIDTR